MLEVGTLLDGKYKILNEIGHGGMSVVYLALNERANKTWAVKEVRKDGGNDSEVVSQGLIAETEMLKKLNHPNLPAIIDVIDRDDSFIIVMDYIEGKSLQDVLKHSGPQSEENVIEWSKQLCDVLGYLHSRVPPIIYRDMKPANVMLKPNGQIALIDFGTAREYKQTSKGDTTWLGTRGYAAPEQFGGHGQTDARTDIYNLGATMYHLLTGYSPADTQFVIYPVGKLRPELAGSGIEKIVAKCCQPEPADRYQNCAELMYALDHVHDEDDAVRRDRTKKWTAFMAACIIALAGVAGMVIFNRLENSTSRRSYEQLISAQTIDADDLDNLKTNYQNAIDLEPSNPKAYNNLLTNLLNNSITDDAGHSFTQEEVKLFRNCINHTYGNRSSSDIQILYDQNRDEYSKLMYNLGLNYFSNDYWQDAYNTMTMSELENNLAGLSQNDQNIRQTIITISDYLVNLNKGQSTYADYQYSYTGLWNALYEAVNDPELTDAKSGGESFSLGLYNMAAMQITMNIRHFVDEGITEDQMNQLLDAAETYTSRISTGTTFVLNLKDQVEKNVEKARNAIESNFGSSVARNNTAQSTYAETESSQSEGSASDAA